MPRVWDYDEEYGEYTIGPEHIDDVQLWANQGERVFGLALDALSVDEWSQTDLGIPDELDQDQLEADLHVLEDDRVLDFVRFSRNGFVADRTQELTAAEPERVDAASSLANDEAEEELQRRFANMWAALEPVLQRLRGVAESAGTLAGDISRQLADLRYIEDGE